MVQLPELHGDHLFPLLTTTASRFSSNNRRRASGQVLLSGQVHLLGLDDPRCITFWSGSPPGSWHRPSPGLTGHGELLDQILEKTITPRPEPEPRSGWLGVHRILLNNSPNLPGLHFIPREASVQVWFGIVWEAAVQAKPRFQPLALASTYNR